MQFSIELFCTCGQIIWKIYPENLVNLNVYVCNTTLLKVKIFTKHFSKHLTIGVGQLYKTSQLFTKQLLLYSTSRKMLLKIWGALFRETCGKKVPSYQSKTVPKRNFIHCGGANFLKCLQKLSGTIICKNIYQRLFLLFLLAL